jgi:8-oxo-dGTP pyrophosphatase MutT (NUDIX family)
VDASGGGVERGESPEEAAVREVREEIGYDVEVLRLLGEDAFTIPADGRPDGSERPLLSVRVVFEARIVGGELTPRSAAPPTARTGSDRRRQRPPTSEPRRGGLQLAQR